MDKHNHPENASMAPWGGGGPPLGSRKVVPPKKLCHNMFWIYHHERSGAAEGGLVTYDAEMITSETLLSALQIITFFNSHDNLVKWVLLVYRERNEGWKWWLTFPGSCNKYLAVLGFESGCTHKCVFYIILTHNLSCSCFTQPIGRPSFSRLSSELQIQR